MSTEVAFQRLYDSIELITGVGDARLGKLCIMSFVSLLAGETFGDRPHSASRVIRKFVIPINDRMDDIARQGLKPFAPRIVGTNDGHDHQRAALLYRAVIEEILPLASIPGGERVDEARLTAFLGPRAAANVHYIRTSRAQGRLDILAKETGHLIASLSEREPDRERRAPYWRLAITLLDRLCDIGADERAGTSSRSPRHPSHRAE